jgi:hypothetical protein
LNPEAIDYLFLPEEQRVLTGELNPPAFIVKRKL